MFDYLIVAVGSALGGALRYGTNMAMARAVGFPWATLTVNYVGSFIIGWIAAGGPSHNRRLFLMTGICGGFTTFSAFSLDTISMMREGNPGKALLYIAASLTGCLAATWLAFRARA
jgi:CrcB protein